MVDQDGVGVWGRQGGRMVRWMVGGKDDGGVDVVVCVLCSKKDRRKDERMVGWMLCSPL